MDGTHADAAGVAPATGTDAAACAPPPTGHDPPPSGAADPSPQAALHGGDHPSRGDVTDAGGSSSAAAARPLPSTAPAPATDAGAADGGAAGAGSPSAAVTPAAATAAAPPAPPAQLVVTLIVKNPGARGARPPLQLEVPLDGTTIGGVKSVLTGLVPGAPPVSAQRLIFAGHLLKNGQSTLRERGGVAPAVGVGPTAGLFLIVFDLFSSLTCRRLPEQCGVVRCGVVWSWGRAAADLRDVLFFFNSLLVLPTLIVPLSRTPLLVLPLLLLADCCDARSSVGHPRHL